MAYTSQPKCIQDITQLLFPNREQAGFEEQERKPNRRSGEGEHEINLDLQQNETRFYHYVSREVQKNTDHFLIKPRA